MLVSYTSRIGREVLEALPAGPLCGNVLQPVLGGQRQLDIAYAREHGITVLGIRD